MQMILMKGILRPRESRDESIDKFVTTKSRNLRDYADACFRYLRATGMVEISQRGHSISIMPEKRKEVVFFLSTIDRKPVYIDDEYNYKKYLFDGSVPELYSDNRLRLIEQVKEVTGKSEKIEEQTTNQLKDILENAIANKKKKILDKQINRT